MEGCEMKGKESDAGEKGDDSLLVRLEKSNALLILLALLFVVFILTKNPVIGIIAGVTFILIFVVDIASGAKEHGWKEEIKGIAVAAGIAIAFWILLIVVTESTTPISGIVSCSMLPRFDRGDMVVLRGVKNFSEINAPTFEMTRDEFDEFLQISSVYAQAYITSKGKNLLCGSAGKIDYICSTALCQRLARNGTRIENTDENMCVVALGRDGIIYYENYSNDVIVYAPRPFGYVSSISGVDIIHRVLAKIKVGDSYYFITKGDNNQVPDLYWLNIVSEQDVKGKVILKIPFFGYFKLFITPEFYSDLGAAPKGCEMTYERAKQ
ncbi:MAG: hypothetical protein QW112_02805 [Candidatus Micrarchaeia archaeon]